MSLFYCEYSKPTPHPHLVLTKKEDDLTIFFCIYLNPQYWTNCYKRCESVHAYYILYLRYVYIVYILVITCIRYTNTKLIHLMGTGN